MTVIDISRASGSRFYRYCSEFLRRAVKIFAFDHGKSSFLAGSFFLALLLSFVGLDFGSFLFSHLTFPVQNGALGQKLERLFCVVWHFFYNGNYYNFQSSI